MKRHSFISALVILACSSCAPTGTTYFGFRVDIRSAPPPPRVVVVDEPAVAVVPGTQVYVVEDPSVSYDMFRYGSSWYICSGGYWYQSSSYRGSYDVVDVRYVPEEILTVPREHWKHHPHGGPPGQMKRRGERGGPGA
jgi:hypothetical protein